MPEIDLPQVTLEGTQNTTTRFPEDLKGKWTLLYFYPKDDTPGCTIQSCGYRDRIEEFQKAGLQVLGVSADDLRSHQAFESKFGLNFPLLCDTDQVLATALQVPGERGLSRDSFLIDPEAQIRKVWRGVHPEKTIEETLEAFRTLQ